MARASATSAPSCPSRACGCVAAKSRIWRRICACARAASPVASASMSGPGRPDDMRRSRTAVGASTPSRSPRSSLACFASGRPRRITAHRLRIVGMSRESSAAAKITWVRDGGSSSVFRSAFCAASFIRSARSMSAMRRPPSTEKRARPAARARIGSMPISSEAPVGEMTTRSVWLPEAIRRHARQAPHGPPSTGAPHMSVATASRASVPAPAPRGPTISRACGGASASSVARCAAAASWPRVAKRAGRRAG